MDHLSLYCKISGVLLIGFSVGLVCLGFFLTDPFRLLERVKWSPQIAAVRKIVPTCYGVFGGKNARILGPGPITEELKIFLIFWTASTDVFFWLS